MAKILEHPLTVTIVSGLFLKAAEFIWVKIGGPNPMETFWNTFVIEMWPMWAGIAIGAIYAFIRFLKRIDTAADRGFRLAAALASRLDVTQNDKEH